MLHYLVSIVEKNDEDVLKLSEDFGPVMKAAERIAMEMLSQELKEMSNGLGVVKDVAKRNVPETLVPLSQGDTGMRVEVNAPDDEKAEVEEKSTPTNEKEDGIDKREHGSFRSGWSSTPKVAMVQSFVPTNKTPTKVPTPPVEQVSNPKEMTEEEMLGATPMGRFSLSATSKIVGLSTEFDEAKATFKNLLQFFGEDPTMTPEAFFCTINTFISMFDQTHKELKRKREAKVSKQLFTCNL